MLTNREEKLIDKERERQTYFTDKERKQTQ